MRTLASRAWLACSSFKVSLWELVVLVAELTQTMCETYGGGLSLTTGVYVECSHPVTITTNAKQLGESRGRLGKGIKPAGLSGVEPLSLVT